jgi:WD repeat-containing protein 89
MHRLSPNRTVVTSFTPKTSQSSSSSSSSNGAEDYYEEGDWVLCVAAQQRPQLSSGKVACALSNGQIQLYDQTTMHLVHTYERNNLVTEMTFETFQEHVLAATANDGSLTLYDVRQQQQQSLPAAMEWKGMLRPDEEALTLSVGFDGNIAAVGSSKGKIHFFDVRSNQGILGSYTQAHTNEVTRVRFQETATMDPNTTRHTTSILVSASEDGLACVFDTSQPTEESAVVNILPVQAPIREVGFFGPKMEAVYCLTGSETMQLYHKDESVCRKDFGFQFRDYLNQQLVQHMGNGVGGQGQPSVLSPMEYLVDCHWDAGRQELSLLTGSVKGDAALFQVEQHGVTPQHYLQGGHRGVIRAWHANTASSSFLTVGEDARMCEWSGTPRMVGTVGNAGAGSQIIVPSRKRSRAPTHQGDGGGKLRRPRSRLAASPY